jgi:predicted dehydrogenase
MVKKIGVGFIGTGFTRKVQMPAFLNCEEASLVSVASGSIENARAASDEFEIGHFTADWRETVSHPDVDLVCITTPPVLHKEMALFAIDAGKHILAEKPMAMNVAEAEQITEAAKGKHLLTLIDHELRFLPGRQKALTMIRGGEIGKIRHARYHFEAPHRGDPNVAWNWWSDIEQGGGALGAINSHIIDSFNFFLGSEISEVFCQLQTNIKERKTSTGELRPVTTDDQANMILRFADGPITKDATGLVAVSMTDGVGYKNEIELFGSEGAIRVGHRGDVFISKPGDSEWKNVDIEFAEPAGDGADTGFSRGFNAFAPQIINAIRHGRTEIEHAATFEDGVKVQRVLDAARRSDATGTAVRVNSKS